MKKWVLIFLGIFLIPLVKADMGLILFEPIFLAFFVFIPIVFIEGTIAYFLLKKDKIKFGYLVFVFFIANLSSAFVGFILFESMGFTIPYFDNFYVAIILFFILTFLIEGLVVYLFLKNKIKKPLSKTIKVSLIVNIISYLLIILLLFLASQISNPSPKMDCIYLDLKILDVDVNSSTITIWRGEDKLDSFTGVGIGINGGKLIEFYDLNLDPLSKKEIQLENLKIGDEILILGIVHDYIRCEPTDKITIQ